MTQEPASITATAACTHVRGAEVAPRSAVCEGCGSDNRLRACTECGHVGCCESQQAHNTQHYQATGHAVIKSLPLDGPRAFTWCYACNTYLDRAS